MDNNSRNNYFASAALVLAIVVLGGFAWSMGYFTDLGRIASLFRQQAAIFAQPIFVFSFSGTGTLNEAGSLEESTSPYFWLNSGGQMTIRDGIGGTLHGELPALHKWRVAYNAANPVDTDEGAHPQNIFRLISKYLWENARVQALFRIDADNLSLSPNRNASNGLLLMTRYQDSDTLYYGGVRVDGTAVVKKKYRGVYYTMAQRPVFQGSYGQQDQDVLIRPEECATYSPSENFNLIPHGEWIGLRMETQNETSGSVRIRLSMLREGDDRWEQLIETRDDGITYGGTPPIVGTSSVGIRTDFMDVSFDSFRVERL